MEATDSQLELASVIGDWGRHVTIPEDALGRAVRVAVQALNAGGSPVDAFEKARGFLRGFFSHPANQSRHLSADARRALAEPTQRAA